MREFDYNSIDEKLLTSEICNLLSAVHEFRGKQDMFLSAKPELLAALLAVAKIQSTSASNKIEGIVTTDARIKALVAEKTTPRNRDEAEIAGYRDVLSLIHDSADAMQLSPNLILQLHRDLFGYAATAGGMWKTSDNVISETGHDGRMRIRFSPMPAFETPDGVGRLCKAFNDARSSGKHDELLLIPVFILDFLCIHPFLDGNGRISRLLTLLLLHQANYRVGKYVSVESVIEKTKTAYYDSLKESSNGWSDGENDPRPFIVYFLGMLLRCYRTFDERIGTLIPQFSNIPKSKRIREFINGTPGKIAKAEIAAACPDVSEITIERTLKEMLDSGLLKKLGRGRGTSYVRQE